MSRKDIARALIETQGELYSEAMGAHVEHDTPQELFHWLVGAIMLSARIGSGSAVEGAKALRKANLHKISEIRSGDRRDLVRTLNESGYARYDGSTADYIRAAADLIEERYGGDLRRLRDEHGQADAILKALQEVKGIGGTGAEIFAREAQLVWDAFYPRADGPALNAADDLGLPKVAGALKDLAGSRERFVRLMAALTRAALDGASDKVKEAAG